MGITTRAPVVTVASARHRAREAEEDGVPDGVSAPEASRLDGEAEQPSEADMAEEASARRVSSPRGSRTPPRPRSSRERPARPPSRAIHSSCLGAPRPTHRMCGFVRRSSRCRSSVAHRRACRRTGAMRHRRPARPGRAPRGAARHGRRPPARPRRRSAAGPDPRPRRRDQGDVLDARHLLGPPVAAATQDPGERHAVGHGQEGVLDGGSERRGALRFHGRVHVGQAHVGTRLAAGATRRRPRRPEPC